MLAIWAVPIVSSVSPSPRLPVSHRLQAYDTAIAYSQFRAARLIGPNAQHVDVFADLDMDTEEGTDEVHEKVESEVDIQDRMVERCGNFDIIFIIFGTISHAFLGYPPPHTHTPATTHAPCHVPYLVPMLVGC